MQLPTSKTKIITDPTQLWILIYGAGKVGKSTFLSKIDKALFISTDAGHKRLETFNVECNKWETAKEILEELKKNPKAYSCVVLDIVDHLYKQCEFYVATKYKVSHHTDLAWGKGSKIVEDEFKRFIQELKALNFPIHFISYKTDKEIEENSLKKTISMPTVPGKAYDLVTGMADLVLYSYTDFSGKRMMKIHGFGDVYCGDRTGMLPRQMELDYDKMIKTLKGEKDA